jgi:uncharacterized protein (TIGR02757 family)
MPRVNIKRELDLLHRNYNIRKYVHPDPVECLYPYGDIKDREIVGLAASCLAYGRAAQILKSTADVLHVMNPCPYQFLNDATYRSIRESFAGFTHRFATGDHIAALLWGIKNVVIRFGSLYECFTRGMSPCDDTVLGAMTHFAEQLTKGKNKPGHLVPNPEKGSACKRLSLFLRWMVRKDPIDPGGWDGIPRSKLIVPLDTHMHRISLALNLTSRNQADMRTALEVTSGFKKLEPDDPLKYDFALTRFGIRKDLSMREIEKLNPDGP